MYKNNANIKLIDAKPFQRVSGKFAHNNSKPLLCVCYVSLDGCRTVSTVL